MSAISQHEAWARILEREAHASDESGADGFAEACRAGAQALRQTERHVDSVCDHPDCSGYGTVHPEGHHGFDR